MAIPTIKEILEKKGVKFGSQAGSKRFEVPKDFFTSPETFQQSRIQRTQPTENVREPIQSIQEPIVEQKSTFSKISERMASGKDLETGYKGMKKILSVPGSVVGGVLGTGSGLIGGIVNYVGESAKQSKDFLDGKVNYWDAQKNIWNQTIKGAKDSAQFGYNTGKGTIESIPDIPLMPVTILFQTGKGVADTFSETGTLYEKYKREGQSVPELRATYDNLKLGSSKGWELLGLSEEESKKISENPFLAGMGNLLLYGAAYLGARGAAGELSWASSKLPIVEMKPSGNRVLMSRETFDSIKNDPNLKQSLSNSKVQILEGKDGQRVAITFKDLQSIKPEAIQSLINENKKVPGFLEIKEFERTKWGALQSKIENGKLSTPKTAYSAQSTPSLGLPEPTKSIGGQTTSGRAIESAPLELPQGRTITPMVMTETPGFQMMDPGKLKGVKTLTKKLQESLAKKEALIRKPNPSPKDIQEVKNLRTIISNLENTVAKTQRGAIVAQGPNQTLQPSRTVAEPATINATQPPIIKEQPITQVTPKQEIAKPLQQNITPQETKVDTLYHGSIGGRLKVDKNGNINLATESPSQYGEVLKLDTSKLKILNFDNASDLFEAVKPQNKEKYSRKGYDVLISGNHAIAINPRNFATKVGQKTVELGRQQIGALIKKATRIIRPQGRPKVNESSRILEERGLKEKARIKQEEKLESEKQKRIVESQIKAEEEARNAYFQQVKQELEEVRRTQASPVVTRKLTPEDLVKQEPKFISKKEKDLIQKEEQLEEQIERVYNARKAINDKEYLAQLTDLKNKGKGEKFFLDLYEKEFNNELKLHEGGIIGKSDVILDFLENHYGFNVIKNILQPIKNIETFLNQGIEKGLKLAWKEIGGNNFYNALQHKLKQNNFTASVGRKFVYNYGLPEWYKDLKQQVKSKQIKHGDMSRNVMDNLSKGLTENQKIQLHEAIINNGYSEVPDIMARAKFAREILDTMGEEFWKSGAISREVYEANKGQYLPRLYFGKELNQPLLQFVRDGGYKAQLHRTKKRGLEKIVSKSTVNEWIEKGWKERAETSDGRMRIWRDYTPEERTAMGEITNEPAYLVAKGIQQIGYDTTVLNLFKEVSQHPDVVSTEPTGDFKQLPETKNYGALRGKYVDPFLYNDIKGIVEAREMGNQIGNKMLSEWKRFKVVDNPATHFRNMYFNFILSDIAGLSPSRIDIYGSSLIDLAKKQGDYREAYDLGLFGSDWLGNELQSLITDKKILDLKPGKNGVYEYDWKSQFGDNILDIISKMKNVYDKVQGEISNVYQAEEHWNKMALYKFAKYDLEMTPQDAVKFAEKWGLNYSAVTPFITKYSTKWYGAPFLRFPVLAAPRLAEGILFRPFTILKWVGILLAVEEFSRRTLGYTRDELKKIKKDVMPGWMQSGLYILGPKLDKNGDPQFLDLTYIVPFIQETKDPMGQLYNYIFGNPIPKTIFEIMLNRSSFTMDDIVNKTLNPTLTEQAFGYTQYVYQQLMPPIAPGNYNFNRLWNAIKQKPDYAGRINDLMGSIATTIFGLKVRSIDVSSEQRWRLIELEKNDNEYAKKIMSIKNDKSLTDKEKKDQIEKYVEMRKNGLKKALEINKVNQPETEQFTNFFLE